MQVVGLAVSGRVGFERAATAIAEAVGGETTVGVLSRRRSDAGDRIDLTIERSDVPSTISYETGGDHPRSALSDAIDHLAEYGCTHALIDANLGYDGPTITVETDTDNDEIASMTADMLDDEEELTSIVEAIEALEPYETLGSLVERIQRHPDSPKAGALATFTGRVRADNLDEGRTTHLEYEKYEDVADQEMATIRSELLEREGVYEVLMHHNTGVVPAEEDAVHVVVLAGHRREAFQTVEDGIDLLKDRVPIFKKEVTESGEYWAHDRP